MQTQSSTRFWREADGSVVGRQDAYVAWAGAAYPRLLAVATGYHQLITYGELAADVQNETGIRTSLPVVYWIGPVLALVVAETRRRGDPPLTALVVHADDGMVGEGYKLVLSTVGEAPIDDDLAREEHAASARLECYRQFCSEMPEDGGVPALAPKLYAKRHGKQAAPEVPPPTCPRCHLVLPLSGICDGCG